MVIMKNKKGYTLIELIITLAIIGIMIVPIYDAFLNSNRVNLRAKRQISAAFLAQNEIEAIKGMSVNSFITQYEHLDGARVYSDSGFKAILTDKETNGDTEFDVVVTIENIELDITANPVISHIGNTRNGHVTVVVPSTNTNGSIKVTDDAITPLTLPLLPRAVKLVLTNDGTNNHIKIDGETFELQFVESTRILIDIVGYEALAVDWDFAIENNSGIDVDIKRFTDELDHISVTPDEMSTSNIYIGNALPMQTATPSTVEEWFRVTVEVSHNGTTYEVIQTTVGK